ncbi:DUF378 domain-containing protein [Anaerovorax odorimutans]|uniref:DUF378 domain-containing protein n=1 Tax=Anaerovorax odorimutans TaxID=109327 RepID=A0ABT1RJS7_9FIRM|nr:DUF378 domain-containing protein [Anaerovorax odorimutans]
MSTLKKLVLALIIIGALNWGLIGFFNFNLVTAIFGDSLLFISKIIFAVVGLSGLYAISFFFDKSKNSV